VGGEEGRIDGDVGVGEGVSCSRTGDCSRGRYSNDVVVPNDRERGEGAGPRKIGAVLAPENVAATHTFARTVVAVEEREADARTGINNIVGSAARRTGTEGTGAPKGSVTVCGSECVVCHKIDSDRRRRLAIRQTAKEKSTGIIGHHAYTLLPAFAYVLRPAIFHLDVPAGVTELNIEVDLIAAPESLGGEAANQLLPPAREADGGVRRGLGSPPHF
jgi:hypothetical protein